MATYIPDHIEKITELGPIARIIVSNVYHLTKKGGKCYMSNKGFGERAGVSSKVAQTNIKKLKENGFLISKSINNGSGRHLEIGPKIPPPEKSTPPENDTPNLNTKGCSNEDEPTLKPAPYNKVIVKNNKEGIGEKKIAKAPVFNFKNSLIGYGFKKELVSDWLKVREKKKAANTETAYKAFIIQVEKTKKDKNFVLQTIVEKSWKGFKSDWITSEVNDSGTQKRKYNGRG